MAQLAIRGHATRGSEVIELLEMLGGRKTIEHCGCATAALYSIFNDRYIDYFNESRYNKNETEIFTLDEFYEKFPYKVGDKVLVKGYESPDEILEMTWNGSEIEYRINIEDEWLTADELKPYEETMEGKLINKEGMSLKIDISQMEKRQIVFSAGAPDETELVLGDNFEIKVEDGKTYVVRKKTKYPKTYEECYKFLNRGQEDDVVLGYKEFLLERFQELLVCRDAYWKIAGDWKPEYKEGVNNNYYTIHTFNNKITLSATSHRNAILAFPTEEMRNQFFENFKELIESCKDFL